MAEWCAERTTAEALAELEKARSGGAASQAAAGAGRPAHPGRWAAPADTEYPGAAAAGAARADARSICRRRRARFRHRAPTLGEHTDAILTELGYRGPAIADLRARGVI